MSGFAAFADGYDGFIVDIWGVVHDGIRPYPGVIDCLERLRGLNKRVVFLTNAPRRAAAIAKMLLGMGIAPALYDGIMSSGEAVHIALRDRIESEFAALGQRFYHLGPERDRCVYEGLPYVAVASVPEAQFLLNTGPDDHLGPDDPGVYAPVLEAALAAGLPMVCSNPDLEVRRNGKRIICAGLLAQMYEAQGGKVILRGKPDPAVYVPTMALLGTARSRTLAIGDSLRTDIAGAKAAGIDSCWVLSGIHVLHPDDAPAEAVLAGVTPKAILTGFGW